MMVAAPLEFLLRFRRFRLGGRGMEHQKEALGAHGLVKRQWIGDGVRA